MDSRQPELSRLTLMCSDHEVAEFTWNHDRQAVTGKTHVLDAAHAPLMATDPSGNITRDRLSSWFKNRGIPDFRPDAADRLRAVGYPSAASLMASGFGASLSDQYWIRPAGSAPPDPHPHGATSTASRTISAKSSASCFFRTTPRRSPPSSRRSGATPTSSPHRPTRP